ncbi:MAG: hypothetical protein K0A95_03020 [Chromatiales bacterium]|nr:hypothetical protein [Chromatiales bacterium]
MHFKIRRYFCAQQPLGRVAGLVRGLVQSFFQAIIVRSGYLLAPFENNFTAKAQRRKGLMDTPRTKHRFNIYIRGVITYNRACSFDPHGNHAPLNTFASLRLCGKGVFHRKRSTPSTGADIGGCARLSTLRVSDDFSADLA